MAPWSFEGESIEERLKEPDWILRESAAGDLSRHRLRIEVIEERTGRPDGLLSPIIGIRR
jgi:hypothetical protein